MESLELPNIKNIILVASGKGGVGKSTVAANTAIGFAREGYKTGILDADIYGPSIPTAFGVSNERPQVKGDENNQQMIPIEKFGVQIMSIGFLLQADNPVIWRGPMASNGVTQLLNDTDWGELDYLIVDLPPGTGDITLTISQQIPQSNAIIVITPQQLAIADGRRAAHMFMHNNLSIPVLGVVENMSYFTPEAHPDEQYYLFGSGGGQALADEIDKPLLAQIPMVQGVCESTDKGENIYMQQHTVITEAFDELIGQLQKQTQEVRK